MNNLAHNDGFGDQGLDDILMGLGLVNGGPRPTNNYATVAMLEQVRRQLAETLQMEVQRQVAQTLQAEVQRQMQFAQQVGELDEKCNAVLVKIPLLESRAEEIPRLREELEGEKNKRRDHKKWFRAAIETLVEELPTAQAKIIMLEEQFEEFSKQPKIGEGVEGLSSKVQALEEHRSEQLEKWEGLSTKVQALEEQGCKNDKTGEDPSVKIEALEKRMRKLEKRKGDSNSTLDISGQVSDYQMKLQKAQTSKLVELEKRLAEVEESRNDSQVLPVPVSSTSSRHPQSSDNEAIEMIFDLSKSLETKHQEFRDSQTGEILVLRERIEVIENERQQQNHTCEGTTSKMTEISKNFNKKLQRLEEGQTCKVSALELRLDEIGTQLAEADLQTKISEQVTELSKTINMKLQKLDMGQTSKITALEGRIGEIEKWSERADSKLENAVSEKINELSENIHTNLQKVEKCQTSIITALKMRIEEIEKGEEIFKVENGLSEKMDELSKEIRMELQRVEGGHSSKTAAFEGRIEEIENWKNNSILENEIAQKMTDVFSDLKVQLKTIEDIHARKVTSLENQIRGAEKRVSSFEKLKGEAIEKINELSKEVQKIQEFEFGQMGKVTGLETCVGANLKLIEDSKNEVTEKILNLSNEIHANIQEFRDSQTNTITGLEGRMDEMQKWKDGKEQSMSTEQAQQSKVAEMFAGFSKDFESKLGKFEESQASLRVNLEEANRELEKLSVELTPMTLKVTGMWDRIQDVEKELERYQLGSPPSSPTLVMEDGSIPTSKGKKDVCKAAEGTRQNGSYSSSGQVSVVNEDTIDSPLNPEQDDGAETEHVNSGSSPDQSHSENGEEVETLQVPKNVQLTSLESSPTCDTPPATQSQNSGGNLDRSRKRINTPEPEPSSPPRCKRLRRSPKKFNEPPCQSPQSKSRSPSKKEHRKTFHPVKNREAVEISPLTSAPSNNSPTPTQTRQSFKTHGRNNSKPSEFLCLCGAAYQTMGAFEKHLKVSKTESSRNQHTKIMMKEAESSLSKNLHPSNAHQSQANNRGLRMLQRSLGLSRKSQLNLTRVDAPDPQGMETSQPNSADEKTLRRSNRKNASSSAQPANGLTDWESEYGPSDSCFALACHVKKEDIDTYAFIDSPPPPPEKYSSNASEIQIIKVSKQRLATPSTSQRAASGSPGGGVRTRRARNSGTPATSVTNDETITESAEDDIPVPVTRTRSTEAGGHLSISCSSGMEFVIVSELNVHRGEPTEDESAPMTSNSACTDDSPTLESSSKKIGNNGQKTHGYDLSSSKGFACLCGMAFPSKLSLSNHINFYNKGKKKYSCVLCGIDFANPLHLTTHHRRVHQRKVSPNLRQTKIVGRNLRKRSLPLATSEKRLDAQNSIVKIEVEESAEVEVKQEPKDSIHGVGRKVMQNGITQFYCKCRKSFLSKVTLTRHIELCNSTEKQFACKFCPNQYLYHSSLKKHLKVHVHVHYNNKVGGSRRGTCACSKCGQIFNSRKAWTQHWRSGVHINKPK